ncbi:MAG: ferrous iron transport protein B, partial [Micrococcales bacterium]|nr:ferrous iron transport protein B [Micrococcales bacterium]
GNYPGVTVERLEATMRTASGETLTVVDVPGCYSLTARSAEEEVAHGVLSGALGDARPGVIVAVVDASNLARNLYLTLQMIELGAPVVVALNMIDTAESLGLAVDAAKLARELGVPVVSVVGHRGTGIDELRRAIDAVRGDPGARRGRTFALAPDDEAALGEARTLLGGSLSDGELLWWLTSPAAPEDSSSVAASALRDRLVADGFGRRVIVARYAECDRIHAIAVDARGRVGQSVTDRVDRVLMHPVWGGLVFVAMMALVFQAVFRGAEPMIQAVEWAIDATGAALRSVLPPGLVEDLVVSGVLAGVGNILVFLPQILMLEAVMAILEDSGYMARAAYLMDRFMGRVGLPGKAFIPLMSSFACAIPGIMAARTVEGRNDRLVTILIAPFMSCSARLPVYTLVVAAVFSSTPPIGGVVSVGGLVMTSMYLIGIAAAVLVAFVLKRTLLKSPRAALVLELPAYRQPSAAALGRRLVRRARAFTFQTGSVILALSILLWALLAFPRQGLPAAELERRTAQIERVTAPGPERTARIAALSAEDAARQLERSVGGHIGHAIEPLIRPLGFDWRIGIGLVASFAAREVLVSTLGQVYAVGSDADESSVGLRQALLRDRDPRTGRPRFTPLVGLSLMVFFVLACQCLSTVAVVRRETNSLRWPLFMIVSMNVLAWLGSFVVFQGGQVLGMG